jgi:hypothetical protein
MKWTMPIRDWKPALNRFTIQFEDGCRFTEKPTSNPNHLLKLLYTTNFARGRAVPGILCLNFKNASARICFQNAANV